MRPEYRGAARCATGTQRDQKSKLRSQLSLNLRTELCLTD
jgi:hypothetical protein